MVVRTIRVFAPPQTHVLACKNQLIRSDTLIRHSLTLLGRADEVIE